jgi:hypothetical protein
LVVLVLHALTVFFQALQVVVGELGVLHLGGLCDYLLPLDLLVEVAYGFRDVAAGDLDLLAGCSVGCLFGFDELQFEGH